MNKRKLCKKIRHSDYLNLRHSEILSRHRPSLSFLLVVVNKRKLYSGIGHLDGGLGLLDGWDIPIRFTESNEAVRSKSI